MARSPLLSVLRSQDPMAMAGIFRDWKSLLRLHFLHAAFESGLLQALGAPRTTAELQEALDARRPELLQALLDLGVTLGELSCSGGRYGLRGRRARALREARNDALAAMVEANVTYYNEAYRNFAARLRGGPLNEGVGSQGPLVARVSKISEPYVERFLDHQVPRQGPLRVLDVGCGSGLHLRRVLERNGEATALGLEVDPAVVLQARRNADEWGLGGRLRVAQGDVRALPDAAAGPFDLVLLFSVVYYFQVPERVAVLRALGERLAPAGVLAVTTSCRGPGAGTFEANLNVATTSMAGLATLPTPGDMEAQLLEAGFGEVRSERLVPDSLYMGLTASVHAAGR